MAYVGTIPAGTVTMSTNQSNIVIQNPGPSGVYPHYASRSSFALGGIQIAAGTLIIIISIIALATYGAVGVVGDIFCGALFASAGACGIAAGRTRTNSPIVGCMVLSIFSAVVSVCGFFVWIVVAGSVRVLYADSKYLNLVIAVSTIFVIVFLVEAIVSIWAAAICCNVACCGRRHTPAMVTPVVQNQHGQLVVTVTHTNQRQYPMPNPPPYTQGGYPMQQPGQGVYPIGATPYGAGMMQNPCPPYQGMPQNPIGSGPPNVAFPGNQGQPGPPPSY